MGPKAVEVLEVLAKNARQVALTEDNRPIQTFPAQTAEHPVANGSNRDSWRSQSAFAHPLSPKSPSFHRTVRGLRLLDRTGAFGRLNKSTPHACTGADLIQTRASSVPINDMITSAGRAPHRQLTAREKEVLALAAAGLTHKEIAERLGISAKTARNHLANLYEKLGIHVRTQAVAHAVRLGLVEL